MSDSGEHAGVGARLLRLGSRPVSLTRRQVLGVLGTGATLAGLGALWHHNRFEIRNALALRLWLPTPFDREDGIEGWRKAADTIRPLFTRKGGPRPGEWLSVVEEPGQSFNQYLRWIETGAREAGRAILVLPFGDFDARLSRVIADAVALTEIFYGGSVTLLPVEPAPDLPADQRRGKGAAEQLFTGPLLDLLKRRVPADAAALIAMTPIDLTPGPGWNFVFGQASLVDRVGVWSLHRLAVSTAPVANQLRRVAGVALHELGHMFGIWHCTAYECCMNGANSLAEADAAPLAFCPECDAKVWWRFRLDPASRYARLAQFAAARGLARDAQMWARCGEALRGAGVA